ncbi:MAG: ABC transporter permease [Maribacter sp.]|nr:ABC transporter permease [Maribacter sp.]
MKSLLLLTIRHFKKRKRQFLLVGATLILTTTILGVALSLIRIMEQPFDITFTNLKASHILLLFDTRSEDDDKITNWFSAQKEVAQVRAPSPYITVAGPLIHKENEIDFTVQLTEHTEGHLYQDLLYVLKGEEKKHPDFGEIWLPSHFETNQGLQLGDTLGLSINGKLCEFRIAAFVVDPHYLSALFNPTRAWIAPGTLAFFVSLSEANSNELGIRLRDKYQLDVIWQRFNEAFDYSGTSLQYPIFKRAFTSFYQLMGSVLLIFSLMALAISLLIIKHTISSHILSDFKQIGVLKTLGFTPRNIIGLYLIQFGLLLLVVLPIGLLGAQYVVQLLVEWVVNSIGITGFVYDLSGPFLISLGIMLFSVFLITFRAARKAGKVKPVEALRNALQGKPVRIKRNSKLFLSKWLPLSIILGITFLKRHQRSFWLLWVNLIAIVFITVFCVNISNSFDQIHSNRTAWGFDKADIQLIRNTSTLLPLEHDQLLEILGAYNAEIRSISSFNYTDLSILSENNKPVQKILGKVYSNSISDAGLGNISGKHPKTVNEISLCIGTSKQFTKVPGDSLAVFIEGQKKTFEVTGIYQDVGNLGQGFRLHENALSLLNPLYQPLHYGLELEKNVDKNQFRALLQEQLGETIQTELSFEERKSMVTMVTNIRIAILAISIFFILVLIILIHNDLNIHISQNQITFVKLKSVGFTSGQLRASLLWKVLLHLILGIIVGIPLSLWIGPLLMNLLTSDIGLVEFPFIPSVIGILGTVVGLLVLASFSTWSASTSIKKVDPRMLSNL